MTAGNLAFHWFLSLFPAVVALLGLASLVGLSAATLGSLVQGIGMLLPAGAADVLTTALRAAGHQQAGLGAVVGGTAVAVVSASSGMAALQAGLDVAYEVPKDRSYLARRAWSVPLMALTLVLGGAATTLLVFGAPIATLARHSVPLVGTASAWLWTLVRVTGSVVLIVALFSALYYLAPNHALRRWRWLTPGSVAGALIWLAASAGFSRFVTTFRFGAKTYGSFVGVAVLILWLYLTGLAVLLGGGAQLRVRPAGGANSG